MATDFFTRQEKARRNTGRLLVLYFMAVAAVVAAVYSLTRFAAEHFLEQKGPFFDPELFFPVTLLTLVVISGGVIIAKLEFRRGGPAVAESLGGRLLSRDTRDSQERMLLNVVEEMAIASGVPVPPVYLMDNEPSINAFAAGWSIGDAAIGVTKGALDTLTRDELQGVMAHEFSHIFNGDMRLNLRLMGWLQGILGLALLGQILLRSLAFRRSRSDRDGGQIVIFIIAIGAGLWIVGSLGILFARLIQAAVSRQREHLADASAVQYTRNPQGLCRALMKIANLHDGARIQHPRAMEAGHFFFANSFSRSNRLSPFATHPPLLQRIQLLDPTFDIKKARATRSPAPNTTSNLAQAGVSGLAAGAAPSAAPPRRPSAGTSQTQPPAPSQFTAQELMEHVGEIDPEHLSAAETWRRRLPTELNEALHDGLGAETVVYGLVLAANEPVRQRQLALLPRMVREELSALEPHLKTLTRFDRLPIAELAISGLRQLSTDQHLQFLDTLNRLISADNQLDLFEMALRRLLTRRLAQWDAVDPGQFGSTMRRPNLSRAQALQILLSGVCYAGHPRSLQEAQTSFRESWGTVPNMPTLDLLPLDACQPMHLDTALNVLAEEAPHRKRWILNAALHAVSSDGELTPSEAEMMRAIGDSLDCPLPPWLTFPG